MRLIKLLIQLWISLILLSKHTRALNDAIIISEICNISHKKPYQLLAYTSLNHSVYQASNFTAVTPKSKKDSKLL